MDPSLLSNSSSLPSIFELLAQSSLRTLLQPAFTHLLALGANHYPRRLIPLAERHEEVWTILLGLVERWSLLKHGLSTFYALSHLTHCAALSNEGADQPTASHRRKFL